MRRNLAILAALAGAGWLTAALADEPAGGWYVGLKAGGQLLEDAKNVGLPPSSLNTTGKYEVGPIVGIDSGYDFKGVRIEGEFTYRSDDLRRMAINNPGRLAPAGTAGKEYPADGSARTYSLMANGYYDFHNSTALTPYIGLGLGAAHVNGNTIVNGAAFATGNDNKFAYQGIIGVNYDFSPHLSTSVEYRYFGTVDPRFTAADGESFETRYHSHALLLGLTYKFGAAAPPPPAAEAAPPAPPAPAPAPPPAPPPPPASKPYLVFFDFDKAVVTADARKVIEQAAADFKKSGKATIVLTGHTDTVGTEAYNMKLSRRRARAVEAVLAKDGVPKSAMTVVGKGKTEPLVPTGDSVREPQNRRVEIVLQ